MITFQGMSLQQKVQNYGFISAAGITQPNNGAAYPFDVMVNYACSSAVGARQLVLDILDNNANLISRTYAGATMSASQVRVLNFGYDHQNMTAFVAVAGGASASAGYLSTALLNVKLPASAVVKVYDIASITNTDVVQVTESFYLDVAPLANLLG